MCKRNKTNILILKPPNIFESYILCSVFKPKTAKDEKKWNLFTEFSQINLPIRELVYGFFSCPLGSNFGFLNHGGRRFSFCGICSCYNFTSCTKRRYKSLDPCVNKRGGGPIERLRPFLFLTLFDVSTFDVLTFDVSTFGVSTLCRACTLHIKQGCLLLSLSLREITCIGYIFVVDRETCCVCK